MENLAEHITKNTEAETAYNLIEEADKLIEETYQYMGLRKEVEAKTMTASNIILKNGKTKSSEVSNFK